MAGGPSQLVAQGILATFAEMVNELRRAGVPVSTTEVLDATEALRYLPLDDRPALKGGLAAALVKEEGHWRAFDMLFELYFSVRHFPFALGGPDEAEGWCTDRAHCQPVGRDGLPGSPRATTK